MVENDLAEVSIRDGEEEISLKKAQAANAPGPYLQAPMMPPPAVGVPAPAAPLAPPPAREEEDTDSGLVAVPSPMVGTFYAAPDPSSPPFVKAGDSVSPESVVCIIEAMKVFNEIKAGVSGVVEQVLVANETAVEFDQPLFKVRPA
ncbi:MAG: acetyl-CoA carboxylase biotin carboxyl carrier protein [bacterium]|nr:acetyl-CoA carboxylase biotin carboxyl carrier protein [bacterium]